MKSIRTFCTSQKSFSNTVGEKLTLVTIGGGAAGYFGAIHAQEAGSDLGVTILEKSRPLSKVKISGGGRCNVTTGLKLDPLGLSQQYPRGEKELKGAFFRRHGPEDTASWFEERGVPLKVEADGRMFPVTNDSSSVVNCLDMEAKTLGVRLRTGWNVSSIHKLPDGTFQVVKSNPSGQESIQCHYLLLTTGSSPQGHKLAQSLGHSIVPPRPSLFTFQVADSHWTTMNGLSFPDVGLHLRLHSLPSSPVFDQRGPLLITHWGVSGPAVLRLSAWAARQLYDCSYSGTLLVDFVPEAREEAVLEGVLGFRDSCAGRKVKSTVPPQAKVPRRFWTYLLQRAGIEEDSLWGACSNKKLRALATLLKRLELEVSGKGVFKEEFVTAGGVPLSEVDMRTMQSRRCQGLYLAGEVVNIDGVTGGFNFQNAWTGGFIAGTSIAASATERLQSHLHEL